MKQEHVFRCAACGNRFRTECCSSRCPSCGGKTLIHESGPPLRKGAGACSGSCAGCKGCGG